MPKKTDVYVPGQGIVAIDGHVTYEEAVAEGRRWTQVQIDRLVELLDRVDEWQVTHRTGGEHSPSTPVPRRSAPSRTTKP